MSPFLYGWILLIIAGLAFDMGAYGISFVVAVMGLLNILAGIIK